MKSLALPEQSAKEDKVLVSVCKTNSWLLHQSEWQATYDNYRLHKGNPWFVTPSSALSAISAKQKKLYDNRCKGGPIRRIRSTKNLVCCPMCGSPTTGSVDHYLPRAVFPEFSILYSNLVPACTHCNSAQKGDLYRGAGCERFIHPYYDAFADQPLWYVSVVPPYRAATFKAKALGGMPAQQTQIVQFHLKHILGEQFTEWVRTQWVRYPLC
jgi:5-methylcytosine-specific restriction endonuclease McrA